MAIQPLGDRILVERLDEDEQTTSGGIIIPDTAKEKPSEGVVKAVGPGAAPTTANDDQSIYPKAIKCYSENLLAPKLHMTVPNISSCVKMIFWQ
jgi:hypothetical protein